MRLLKIKNNIKRIKIYIMLIILGITDIMFAVLPINESIYNNEFIKFICLDSFNNIMIGLGTGLITSAITSYLIEKSNLQIKKENDQKIKENIVYELNSYVKYNLDDIELMLFENLFNKENLSDIINKCENCLVLGVTFYNNNELDTLQNLYGHTQSLKKQIKDGKINELYYKYKDLFKYSIIEQGQIDPFVIQDKIKESIRGNLNRIDEESLWMIVEFHVASILYIYRLNEFIDVFKFIRKE